MSDCSTKLVSSVGGDGEREQEASRPMDVTIMLWVGFAVFIGVVLAFDLGVFSKEVKAISGREALVRCGIYFSMAMVFNAGIFWFQGAQKGLEFLTGYLIEYSLSLDNIFVIVLIFSHFAVPPQYQHRVLFWGILGALVMRGILIVAGTALIHQFHWIIYVFGAFLIFSGIKMLRSVDDKPNLEENRIVKFVRSRFRMTETYHGEKFFVTKDGVRFLLAAGAPLREPVAWQGPIVMNSRAELFTAFQELRSGTFLKEKAGFAGGPAPR